MPAGITIMDGVSAHRGGEAARLQPLHAVCVTVDWPLPPDDSEQSLRREVVTVLSHALASCGHVAFRWDEALKGALAFYPPAPPSIMDRFLAIANRGDASFGVVVASEVETIAALFDYGGWSYAVQAALVFDPSADPLRMVDALRRGLDWRGREMPAGARLLFGPGHDGDFAVLAAADAVWVARFSAALGL